MWNLKAPGFSRGVAYSGQTFSFLSKILLDTRPRTRLYFKAWNDSKRLFLNALDRYYRGEIGMAETVATPNAPSGYGG
jgi:hypothetical protein